jgi:hypothetical protein
MGSYSWVMSNRLIFKTRLGEGIHLFIGPYRHVAESPKSNDDQTTTEIDIASAMMDSLPIRWFRRLGNHAFTIEIFDRN